MVRGGLRLRRRVLLFEWFTTDVRGELRIVAEPPENNHIREPGSHIRVSLVWRTRGDRTGVRLLQSRTPASEMSPDYQTWGWREKAYQTTTSSWNAWKTRVGV